jgi:hypothetical protein
VPGADEILQDTGEFAVRDNSGQLCGTADAEAVGPRLIRGRHGGDLSDRDPYAPDIPCGRS